MAQIGFAGPKNDKAHKRPPSLSHLKQDCTVICLDPVPQARFQFCNAHLVSMTFIYDEFGDLFCQKPAIPPGCQSPCQYRRSPWFDGLGHGHGASFQPRFARALRFFVALRQQLHSWQHVRFNQVKAGAKNKHGHGGFGRSRPEVI